MNGEIKEIGFSDILLHSGFWGKLQKLNRDTTLYSVWERCKETGRFQALNFDWTEGAPHKPHIFWDSDIAKWVEAAAFILSKESDQALEAAIDEVVTLIEAHQDPSGYFNIYFTVVEPEQRFKRRTDHELYCAGHLMEAAVAYFQATGKDKFLKLMQKYADHIEQVFKIDRSAAFTTCGHEEIELALVKLYHATGEKRYLELSKFFIDNRGTDPENQYYEWANASYAQDHLPVRQQSTAEGHAVRAVYLYSAMADLSYEYSDQELFAACRRIFDNITTRRMYVTGGIGSSPVGEAFTIDYDLPNLTAYTESCASIGLALFARRMLRLETDAVYADITERVLYNGFLSSLSLDGKSFFYENPLEIHPELVDRDKSVKRGKGRLPITLRKEVFDCSCCPPNISRLIASIGDFLYTYDKDTLFVHQYMASEAKAIINGAPVEIKQQTSYPADGKITFTIQGDGAGSIGFRIPYWCPDFSLSIDGTPVNKADIAIVKGYARVSLAPGAVHHIVLDLQMPVQLIEAAPMVQEDSGRVALQRGPVIYCLEAVDNGGLLRDVRISPDAAYEPVPDSFFGVPVIHTAGFRRKPSGFESGLYKPVSCEEPEKIDLKFIPYFGFANRGESEMVVWVLKK